jgi:hypothetical protein
MLSGSSGCRTIAGLTLIYALATSAPARAQAQPPPAPESPPEVTTPATEKYHIEASVGVWFPQSVAIQYEDTENSVTGTDIDFVNQLGLRVHQRLPQLEITVRLNDKQKLRGEYIRLRYSQTATLTTPIDFNGSAYAVGDVVSSTLTWNAWKVGYEYDFLTTDRYYVGGLIEMKDVAVSGTLNDSALGASTASVQVPMPGIGGTARYYVLPKLSVTGEAVYFGLPGSAIASTSGHSLDIDAYATFNLIKYLGVQAGFRSFDTTYTETQNTGTFTVRGAYVGVVVRK